MANTVNSFSTPGTVLQCSTSICIVVLSCASEGFDVIVATHKTIDLVFQTQVYKLKRDMQPHISLLSLLSTSLRQNRVVEGSHETPVRFATNRLSQTRSSRSVCSGRSGSFWNTRRTPMQVALYARVSTLNQQQEGTIASQVRALEALYSPTGLEPAARP